MSTDDKYATYSYETFIYDCTNGNTFDFTEWRESSNHRGGRVYELVNCHLVNNDNRIVAVFKKRDGSSYYSRKMAYDC